MKKAPKKRTPCVLGAAALLTAAMALPALDFASAEAAPDKTMIGFKFLDYAESQALEGSSPTSVSGASGGSGISRILVHAFTVSTVVPVAGRWSVGMNYTLDTVSGASPQYHTSGLAKMSDRRNAEDVSVTRYFDLGTVTFGGSYSSESDYISHGYSILGTRSTDDKNTTWSFGASLNDDTISPTIPGAASRSKKIYAGLAGVTWILTPNDITQFNLGFSHGSGYYSDPYKVSDNRPDTRNIATVLTRWNHHFDSSDGTARISYRFYTDSFGIRAHTLEGEYVQPVSRGWTLAPLLRLYSQNEADFYIATSGPNEATPPPVPAGQVYSTFDQRLSAFGAMTAGIKVIKKLNDDVHFDTVLSG